MVKKKFIIAVICSFYFSIYPFAIWAEERDFSGEIIKKKSAENGNGEVKRIAEDDKGIFTVALENDLFTGSDSGYTNGARFSYISSESQAPELVKKSSSYLPMLNKEGKKRVSIAVGQDIYTSSDIKNPNPPKNDSIYAGWLYSTLGLVSDSGNMYDSAELTLGVVGPSSKAEQTQKYVQGITGSPQPKGWRHQLKDEPGINFSYERKWREIIESEPFGVGFDVIPHSGVSLGNINTSAVVGATFRIGYDLPTDYGPPRIRPTDMGSDFFMPSKRLSGYLFSVLEMRAVAQNIFLDGNTFKDSESLDKRVMVKSAKLGGALILGDARLSYTYIFVTKEFKGQVRATDFGALSFSYRI